MIRRILVTAVGAVGLSLLGLAVASAAIGDIYDTEHSLGTDETPTCMICHTPHSAEGDYLFARPPKEGLPGLSAFCFSCHDGSAAPGTDVGAYILNPGVENHIVYPGVEGLDCDLCHDPHESSWKFVAETAIPVEYRGSANLCFACHKEDDSGMGEPIGLTHPVDVVADDWPPMDRTWDPSAEPPDPGTRLFDEAGNAEVPSGSGYVKCATCHAAHGAIDDGDRLNTMLYRDPASSHSPLCENCHYSESSCDYCHEAGP